MLLLVFFPTLSHTLPHSAGGSGSFSCFIIRPSLVAPLLQLIAESSHTEVASADDNAKMIAAAVAIPNIKVTSKAEGAIQQH